MRAEIVERIETGVERAATAIFAGAVAFAAFHLLALVADQPGLGAFTAAAGAFAYLLCDRVFQRVVRRGPRFPVPIFDLGTIERPRMDELILTDADRLQAAVPDEPLVLDDILAELGPDSRVVRLFDPAAMPTPGQLKARIDQHLETAPPAASPDASQALYDALAELRRSMR